MVRRYVLMLSVYLMPRVLILIAALTAWEGRYLYVQDLSVRKFFCIDGGPLADKFPLIILTMCLL